MSVKISAHSMNSCPLFSEVMNVFLLPAGKPSRVVAGLKLIAHAGRLHGLVRVHV